MRIMIIFAGSEMTMIKTFSFAAVHFSVAFAVAYLLTGNWLASSLTALIEPCVNTVAYYWHEKIWQRRERRPIAPAAAPRLQVA